MYCPTCGVAAAAGAKFCTRCGGNLGAVNSPAAVPPPAASVAPISGDVPYAGFWRRFGGFVIDYVTVVFVVALVAVIPLGALHPPKQLLPGLLAIAYIALPWAYYAGMARKTARWRLAADGSPAIPGSFGKALLPGLIFSS
jgi:hypothetical protein